MSSSLMWRRVAYKLAEKLCGHNLEYAFTDAQKAIDDTWVEVEQEVAREVTDYVQQMRPDHDGPHLETGCHRGSCGESSGT